MTPKSIFKTINSTLSSRARHLIGVALCLTMLASGCTGNNSPVISKKDIISVSIEPQRWLLEQIVGDRMEVKTLMANGGNPETYEPSFSHLAGIKQSRAFFQIGNLGFETAIIEKVRANNPELPIFTVSDSINLIRIDHDHGNNSHGSIDPHTWTSVKNAKIMARNMMRAMVEIDSLHANEYINNFIGLSTRLDSLDSLIATTLPDSAAFLVWHPSLSYFARDYGLKQIAMGAEGRDPSIADVRRLINQAEKSGAGIFLIQRDFDRNQADALLKGLSSEVKVAEFAPLSYDFDSQLINIANAIAGTTD